MQWGPHMFPPLWRRKLKTVMRTGSTEGWKQPRGRHSTCDSSYAKQNQTVYDELERMMKHMSSTFPTYLALLTVITIQITYELDYSPSLAHLCGHDLTYEPQHVLHDFAVRVMSLRLPSSHQYHERKRHVTVQQCLISSLPERDAIEVL